MIGRIRTIKPEALLDEELWDVEQKTGLPLFRAFTGLWTYADREGRFEWKARPLKSVILPYWDGDMETVLNALWAADLIVSYEVDGRRYGLVRNFKKHQVINNKEAPSRLPEPPKELPNGNGGGTRGSRVPVATANGPSGDGHAPCATPDATSTEGKGREGNWKGREEIPAGARVHAPAPTHVREEPQPPAEPAAKPPAPPDASPPAKTGRMRRVTEPLTLTAPEAEPELAPGEPEVPLEERRPLRQTVRARFEKRFFERMTVKPAWHEDNITRCASIADWLETNHAGAELAALDRLLRGFFGSARAEAASFPIAFLATNPPEYFVPAKPTRDVRKGFADPSPPGSFTPTNLDEAYGPRPADFDERLKRAGNTGGRK